MHSLNAKQKTNKGITMVSLVITIIVLLILAGITIGSLTGDNHVVKNTISAKEQAEINGEIKVVVASANESKNKDKYGDVKKETLEKALNGNTGTNKTTVEEIKNQDVFLVTFNESNRIYAVNGIGNVDYIGNTENSSNLGLIRAIPEEMKVPRTRLAINLVLITVDEANNVQLDYAWNKSDSKEPNTYVSSNPTKGSGENKDPRAWTSTINSPEDKGEYYLWVKGKVGEGEEIVKTFGPYLVQDIKTITDVVLAEDIFTYDGKEKEPGVIITDEGKTLQEGTDYVVEYKDNIEVGTGHVVITGMGQYVGTITKDFTIVGKKLPDVTLAQTVYKYDGTAKTPAVSLIDGTYKLVEGTDYTVEYKNNTQAGTAQVVITGKGNYAGTVTKEFIITDAKTITNVILAENTYTYDGTAKTPLATVESEDGVLQVGTDYTIEYKNNVNAGTAQVVITGKGEYSGTVTKEFTINGKPIENVELARTSYIYDGTEKKPEVIVKDGTKTLVEGTDYTVEYKNNTNAGKATAIVRGKGNYTGTIEKEFNISGKSLPDATLAVDKVTYDGAERTPSVEIKDGDKVLKEGVDYTIEYKNNTDVGTAEVVITGKGNYTGTQTKEFTIEAKTLPNATLESTKVTYDGTEKKPKVVIKDGTKTLVEGTDYTVEYKNNVNTGKAEVVITGKGNYAGTQTKEFTIEAKTLPNATLESTKVTYDGTEKKPEVVIKDGTKTLVEGTDYTVEYKNNVNTGKAEVVITGKGNYAGTQTKEFTIEAKTLPNATLESTKVTYDGTEKKPKVVIKDGTKTLVEGTDYTVEYKNNVNTGKAEVVITGKGNYAGTQTKEFTIEAKTLPNATLESTKVTYDGTEKKPKVVIKDGTKTLVEGTDYTVEYKNNVNTGKAEVVITGKGNYAGTQTKEFTIEAKTLPNATLESTKVTYDGTEKKPKVVIKDGTKTLVEGTDYTVEYKNNVNTGKAEVVITGKGNYAGTQTKEFTIEGKQLPNATLSDDVFTYDGTEKKPAVVIKDGTKTLVEGTDYTVTYKNNTNAGTAQVVITGKGNYAGTQTKEFTIEAKSLPNATLESTKVTYDGTEKKPKVVIKDGTKTLVEGTDYTVEYKNNVNTGKAEVVITGKGNYAGTQTKEFTIEAKTLPNATLESTKVTYDGTEKKPKVVIKDGTKTLVEGTDYTVEYKNNVNTGKAEVVITGKGNYAGTQTKEFTIEAKTLPNATLESTKVTYDGTEKKPKVIIKDGTKTLVEGTDYTVEYKNNVNTGKAEVVITGKGNYAGTQTKEFTIEGKQLPNATLSDDVFTYDGTEKKPEVVIKDGTKTLVEGTDYTVTYKNNTNAGTAQVVITGKGNYAGTQTKEFTINAKQLPNATLSNDAFTYDGTEKKPAVVIKDGTKTLVEGTDYTVKYENNTDAGKGKVTITGKGNYAGTQTKEFTIEGKQLPNATLSDDVFTYDGTEKKPAVVIKDGTKTLVEGTDYTVTYKNNTNAGTAQVVITGKGNYAGTQTKDFTINAKQLPNGSLKNDTFTYDGTEKKPEVVIKDGTKTLVEGTDYTVTYKNNTNVGTGKVTVTGKGNYTGTKELEFTINAKNVEDKDSKVTVNVTGTYTYTGSAITPTLIIKDGETVIPASNYDVKLTNNVNAGTANVEVTFKGNYTGKKTTTFTINAKNISGATVTTNPTTYVYDGTAKTPAVTVKDGTKTLVEGTDYTKQITNNTNAGTATVTITGKGNYTGTKTGSFTITAKNVEAEGSKVTVATTGTYTYTGSAITPTLVIKDGETVIPASNYDVKLTNNVNAGTANVEVTFKGNYTGKKTTTFTINAKNISGATVTTNPTTYVYDGTAKTPAVTVKDGTKTLTAGTDYTAVITNNVNAGTATVTITGKGNYTGTKTGSFTITAKNVEAEGSKVTVAATGTYTYTGSAITPTLVIKDGENVIPASNYDVKLTNNVNAGTANVEVTFKGNYTGKKTTTFTINAKNISGASITTNPTTYVYDGTAKTPAVTVKDGTKTLTEGTDYTKQITNNTNAGTATVTITGKGNYTGTKTGSFTITAKNVEAEGSKVTVNVTGTYTYTGSAITPTLEIKDDTTTIPASNYDVKLTNNVNAGTANVEVTFKGNYTGKKTTTFTIGKADIGNSVVRMENYAYDGQVSTPSVSLNPGNATVKYYYNTTNKNSDGTEWKNITTGTLNVGTYYMYAVIPETANYKGKTTAAKEFKVTKTVFATTVEMADYVYNGTVSTPRVSANLGNGTVTYYYNTTNKNSDGTEWKNITNTTLNAGTYYMYAVIAETTNYAEITTAAKSFKVTAKNVEAEGSKVTVKATGTYTYTGSAITPTLEVKDDKTTIPASNYDVKLTNNVNAGTANVEVTFKGNYTGKKTTTFTINAKNISGATVTTNPTTYVYDGTAKTPAVTVKDGTKTLTAGTDYTAVITNNVNAGTATVTITGKGNYTGTKTGSFTITAKNVEAEGSKVTVAATGTYTYTGSAITPTLVIKDGETVIPASNYDVKLTNNVNAGTANVEVTFKGNYTGKKTTTFTINAKNISGATVTTNPTTYVYDGTAKTPAVTVKDGTKTLVEGTDYTKQITNNTNAGTATVTITGKGNYTGTKTGSFTITAKNVEAEGSKVTVATTGTYTYTGSAITPTLVIKDGETVIPASNYDVKLTNNVNAGTANVEVTFKGNYTGKKTTTFTIAPKSVTASMIVLNKDSFEYTGSAINPTVTIKDGSKTLTNNTDYTVAITNNTNVGKGKVTITGKGNYTGTAAKEFTITAKNVEAEGSKVTVNVTGTYTYTGSAITPTLEIKDDTTTIPASNYDVKVTNNVNAGTANVEVTFKGNYTGKKTTTFTIAPKAVTASMIGLNKDSFEYTGSTINPTITVKDGDKTLTNNTDYTVAITNNTDAGKGKVTITGKGNYTGTATKEFTITKANSRLALSKLTGEVYTGATFNVANLVTAHDGTVTYSLTDANNGTTTKSTMTTAGVVTAGAMSTSDDNNQTVKVVVNDPGDKNHKAGSKTVTITVKKNTRTIAFKSSVPSSIEYNKTATAGVDVTGNGGTQGTVTYSTSNANVIAVSGTTLTAKASTGKATITATMARTATVAEAKITKEITVTTQTLTEAMVTLGDTSKVYTGSALTTTVTVKDGSTTLTKDTDYTVEYKDNVEVGTAQVVITGKGKYSGTITKTFTITKANSRLALSKLTGEVYTGATFNVANLVTAHDGTVTYSLTDANNGTTTKSTMTTAGVVTAGAMSTSDDNNQTVKVVVNDPGDKNHKAGSKTVTITVKKNTRTIAFKSSVPSSIEYNKTATAGVDVTGNGGTQGTVTYSTSNANVIAVSGTTLTAKASTGKATITATMARTATVAEAKITKEITVTTQTLTEAMVTLGDTSKVYTGSALTTTVTVKDGSTTLTKDTDYTVEYKDNIEVGTAQVVITGKGKYSGTITKTFTITKANSRLALSKLTGEVYTGATFNVANLVTAHDGTVTYSLTDANNGTTTKSTMTTAGVVTAGAMSTSDDKNQTVKVVVNDPGDKNHKAGSKTVTITVKKNTRTIAFKSSVPSSIQYNKTATAGVDVTGNGGTPGTVTYSTSDANVIAVSGTTLTAKASTGKATITATMARTTTVAEAKITKEITVTTQTLTEAMVTLGDTSKVYTGSALTTTVTVKDGSTTLTKDTDYTVEYKDNIEVGTAQVVITGKGKYSGTITKTFTITKANSRLALSKLTGEVYTGATFNVANLVTAHDGTVTYSLTDANNGTTTKSTMTTAGVVTAGAMSTSDDKNQTVKVVVNDPGDKNHKAGSKTVTITVKKNTRTIAFKSSVPSSIEYNKTATAGVDVTGNGGTQGTVTYSTSNANVIAVSGTTLTAKASTGKATITATMARTATVAEAKATKEISVTTQTLTEAMVTLGDTSKVYTGSALTTTVTVKDGSTTLTKDTDYTVEYKDNIEVGTAQVVITGKGKYSGTITKTFTITKANSRLALSKLTGEVYTGATFNVANLVTAHDGTVTYSLTDANNGTTTKSTMTTAGVVTAGAMSTSDDNNQTVKVVVNDPGDKNHKAGSKTVTITVKKNTRTIAFKSSVPSSIEYNKTATAGVDVTGNGGTQGTVTYSTSNANVIAVSGTTLTAKASTGKATITATMARTATVAEAKATKEISVTTQTLTEAMVTLGDTSKVYTGSALTTTVTVKDGSTTLTKDTDYTVEYKDNVEVGTAQVVITGKGKYSGTITKTFTITKANSRLALSKLTGEVYTGATFNVANLVTAHDGTVTYSLTDANNGTTTKSTMTTAGVVTAGAMSTSDDNNQTVKVVVNDPGDKNHKAGSKTVTITVKKNTRTIAFKSSVPSSIEYNKTATAGVDVTGNGGTQGSITYSTSNANVIAVSGTTLTAKASTGKATITATMARTTTVAEAKITKEITVTTQTLTEAMVTLGDTSKVYTGSALTTTVTVKDGSTTLTKDTDYTVEYKDNIEVGTAQVVITGKGKYSGTITKTFTITKANSRLALSKLTGEVYTGATFNVANLVTAHDGTVTYSLTDANNGTTTKSTMTTAGVVTAGAMSTSDDKNQTVKVVVNDPGDKNHKAGSKTVTITVKKNTRTIAFKSSVPSSIQYNKTATAGVDVTGNGGTQGTVTYSTSNANVIAVSGTTLTAKASTGKATITATMARTATVAEAKTTKEISVTKATVGTPSNVQVSTAGIVTWTAGANATGYQISIDGTNWTSASSGVNYLSTITGSTGNRTVYVRAVNSDTTNYTTPSSNATKTVTVYAVTFKSNSTTMGTVNTTSYNVISGVTVSTDSNKLLIKSGNTTLKTITATAKTGYSFDSWSKTSGSITAATEITATFKANTYKVSFNANNGTGGQSADVTATYAAAMPSISTTAPTRSGYTFQGWYDNSDYTKGTQYYKADGTSARSWNKTSATTLYAGWKINSYTVTYNATENGGTLKTGSSSASVNYNAAIDVSKTTHVGEKSGYTFVGWNTNKNATTALSSLTMNTSNVTLYAIYSKTLKGTFYYYNSSDATKPSSTEKSVTIYNKATSGKITSPAASGTPTNYTFRHWSTSEAADANSTVAASKETTISANTSYYASYQTSITATFYYSKAANGTTASSTANGTRYMNYKGSYKQGAITAPTISGEVAPTGTARVSGWATAHNNMGAGTTYNTGTTKYYAVYRNTVAIYRPTAANGTNSASKIDVYRNAFLNTDSVTVGTTKYTTVIATENTGTSNMTSVSGLWSSATFAGYSTSANTSSITNGLTTVAASIAARTETTYYTIATYTTSVTATFYYSKAADGTTASSTAKGTQTRNVYCSNTTTATSNVKSNGTITPPTISGEVAPTGTTRVDGWATAHKNMGAGTTYNTGTTKYYAVYRTNVDVYKPKSTSASEKQQFYRNAFLNTSSVTAGTTKYTTVLSTSSTGTSNGEVAVVSGYTFNKLHTAASSGGTAYTVAEAATTNITTFYASETKSVTGTFYYNSNTTAGSFTKASKTATATSTLHATSKSAATITGNYTIPTEVTGSVGKYNSEYVGVATEIKTMSSSTSASTAHTTFYAVYRTEVTIYRPSSVSAASAVKAYRNEYFAKADGSTFDYCLADSTTGISTMTGVSGLTGTLKGFATAVNNITITYDSIGSLRNSTETTAYAVSTTSETATFYYNSNATSGLFTKASKTATATKTIYCKTNKAATTIGNYTIPTEVTGSKGKYNSAYVGVATEASTMTSSTSASTAHTKFYAVYRTGVTIHYPKTTKTKGSYSYFRNEYLTAADGSTIATKLATTDTGTSDFTFTSSISGYSLYGFGTSEGSNTRTYSSVEELGDSDTTTAYAILRKSVEATFYYYNGSAVTNAKASAYQYVRCTSSAAEISDSSITIPTAVTGSKGSYGSAYVGVATEASTMTSSTSASTEHKTYYAVYRTNVTIYRPSSTTASTSQAFYRNQWLTSTTEISDPVLTTSKTGKENVTPTMVSGYMFYRLYASPSSGGTAYTMETAAKSTITTFYTREYKYRTITFYSGVSKATTNEVDQIVVIHSTSKTAAGFVYGNITTPTPAAITNWTTLGWRNDTTADEKEQSSATSINPDATTYYAVYSRTLTISYNKNSGTGTTANTTKTIYLNTNSTTTSSQSVELAENKFTRSGYVFYKWAVGSASSSTQIIQGEPYNPGFAYNASSFTKTMYATWKKIVTLSYRSGNYLYNMSNMSNVTDGTIKYTITNSTSIDTGKITATSQASSGEAYGFTAARFNLEANKEYSFTCTTDGTWGTGTGDTVEAFLMYAYDTSKYVRMASNTNFKFTVPVAGPYKLRVDINGAKKTHWFNNISVQQFRQQTDKVEGLPIGTMPAMYQGGFEFLGYYLGSTKIEPTTLCPSTDTMYTAKWKSIVSTSVNKTGNGVIGKVGQHVDTTGNGRPDSNRYANIYVEYNLTYNGSKVTGTVTVYAQKDGTKGINANVGDSPVVHAGNGTYNVSAVNTTGLNKDGIRKIGDITVNQTGRSVAIKLTSSGTTYTTIGSTITVSF